MTFVFKHPTKYKKEKAEIKALDNFVYTDKNGVKNNHLKKLPLKSKKLFISILKKHNKRDR